MRLAGGADSLEKADRERRNCPSLATVSSRDRRCRMTRWKAGARRAWAVAEYVCTKRTLPTPALRRRQEQWQYKQEVPKVGKGTNFVATCNMHVEDAFELPRQ